MKNYFFIKILKCVAIGVLAILFFSFVVMGLWNFTVPTIFNGPEINLVQAGGLLILSKILFSGFGGRGRCGHCGHGGFKEHWKEKFKEKYANLSPEEKEKLKSKFDKFCGDKDC